MKITDIRINGIDNPLGFAFHGICCSWHVTDTEAQKQKYASIEVSDSETFEHILCQKEGADLKQSGERLELSLTPRTTYYYRVFVEADTGDVAVSDTGFFETGKMNEGWKADWISPDDEFHPVITKSFQAAKKVKRARLYITGVGLFEAYLNGEKLGNEYLTPYINHYETNIQVMTFVLDGKLGENNLLEIILGKGWYMGTFGLELQNNNYGDRMAVIAELHLEYEDGNRACIVTDDSWHYYGSDIEDSSIYDGEIIDRLLWEGKENRKKPVEVIKNPERSEGTKNLEKTHIMDRISLPVLVMEEMAVKEVIFTSNKETVLDMGQNFAGFIEFTADFPKGTQVVLDFGEILQNGNFYNRNYRAAKSRFVYISGGKKEVIRPHFTFFGFRYVRVTGWKGEVKKTDFIGKVLYSDIKRTGFIKTSNQKINRLYENTIWSLKSNFIDMPMDCPQRSERLGWTGDAQVFAPTASYHMDTRAFFHKFVKDLRDEQNMLGGGVPNYVPNIGHKDDVGSVWGDIATFLPNTLFAFFGNLDEMAYCYPLMKDWVDYIDGKDGETGFCFGDWLALDGPAPTSFKGGTDDSYISSLYYFRSVQILQEMAARLNKTEDANHYRILEEQVKKAIFSEYFTPNGRLSIDTQAAYVIALKFNIYTNRDKILEQFKLRLQKDGNQIKCGFVGAPLICTVLSEAGLTELAYDLLLREDFPSWLYSVNLGATTIWERWNSVLSDGTINDTGMNSLNHYAYGSVMEFVYAYAAGIRPLEPGFKSAIIAPVPDIRLHQVQCSYHSVNGEYVCDWQIRVDGTFKVHIKVPFDCKAEVELPGYPDGKMNLEAGDYHFTYTPRRDFRKPYHEGTTLARIARDQKAAGILNQYTPALAGIAASGDPEFAAKSLAEIRAMAFLPFEPDKLQKAIEEISQLIL